MTEFELLLYNILFDVMFLWGVALLVLDNHPDHNKGPDQRTLRKH